MNVRKALLVKFLRELLTETQLVSVITTNPSHRYPEGRDQNGYKLTIP